MLAFPQRPPRDVRDVLIAEQQQQIAELAQALQEQIDLTLALRDRPCPRCEARRAMRDQFDRESA